MQGATRTVTVMFSDMVESTARVTGNVDPELRQHLFDLLRTSLARSGGTEVKNLGDGLMATFPSVQAGLACGVLTQQRVARFNRRGGETLHVRIGLAMGDAVEEDHDWFGRCVVEAARLCDTATADQILVTEAVRALAGNAAPPLESVGALELKGLGDPVAAYSVDWTEVVAEAGEGLPVPPLLEAVRATGFSARTRERARVEAAVDAAAGGSRQVVLVAGEPGIGKTSLTAEAAIKAHQEGATVLYGRCEEDLGIPYEPFVEALEHLIANAPADLLESHVADYGGEVARLVPKLAQCVAELPPRAASDPESERYLLFAAVAGLLGAAARDDPVLLLLDDLHWADLPTLQLTRHLVSQLRLAGVVVIGTYRDTEVGEGHPVRNLVADLHREPGVTLVELAGFEESEVIELMERLAGHDLSEDGERLARTVQQETAGNPFFIREMLRNMRESGALERSGGRWGPAGGDQARAALPSSVRDVILRRVGRLSEPTRAALLMASVVGHEFDLDLLGRALEADEDELADQLDEAVESALLQELPGRGGRFTFPHALVEYTLYENMGPARRRRGHARVAAALEQICAGNPGARVAELAYHYGESATGDRVVKAFEYATAAGDRALQQLAPDEGVRWYGQALELLGDDAAGEQRCDALIRLGTAQSLTGDAGYGQTLFDAAELAGRIGDNARFVRAALANKRESMYTAPGQVDHERVDLLERALDAVGPDDSRERAELLARLANELHFCGDPERPRALSDEALAIARRVDHPDALIGIVAERMVAIWTPETLTERTYEAEEAVTLTRRAADPLIRSHAYRCRCAALVCAGELERAQRDVAEVRALARRAGHPLPRWLGSVIGSTIETMLGRLEVGEELAGEAFAVASGAGYPDAEFVYGAQLAQLRFEQGHLHELVDQTRAMTQAFPGVPAWQGVLALTEAEAGNERAARDQLAHGAAAGFVPLDIAWGSGVGSYAIACARYGDAATADALYPLLAPYASQVAYTGANSWLTIAHHLGALARVAGRLDDAAAHLAHAAELAEAMNAPIWLARTRLEQARVRLLKGEPATAVAPIIDEVRTTAARHGAAGLERDATRLEETGMVVPA